MLKIKLRSGGKGPIASHSPCGSQLVPCCWTDKSGDALRLPIRPLLTSLASGQPPPLPGSPSTGQVAACPRDQEGPDAAANNGTGRRRPAQPGTACAATRRHKTLPAPPEQVIAQSWNKTALDVTGAVRFQPPFLPRCLSFPMAQRPASVRLPGTPVRSSHGPSKMAAAAASQPPTTKAIRQPAAAAASQPSPPPASPRCCRKWPPPPTSRCPRQPAAAAASQPATDDDNGRKWPEISLAAAVSQPLAPKMAAAEHRRPPQMAAAASS
ncbi:uncharacterized protein LOC143828355 [Paroedura picta]|uniref:uncharacterized protein LOC143828355 n=1 Tax=Paroedura picta TaxID=143630 RepID=UPI004055CB70